MIYRQEHPKPQFERKTWKNLNGKWEFAVDEGDSGEERKLFEETVKLKNRINVPFCPESELSGIGNKDFMSSVWYKRKFTLTAENLRGRTFIRFGAVDHKAFVYINGNFVGKHVGGYSSFSFEITDFVREGENDITVNAKDDTRDPLIPTGKQSTRYYSYSCCYTRTTGIWQTVWLEFTPETYVKKVKYLPDANAGTLTVVAELEGRADLSVNTSFGGRKTGGATVKAASGVTTLTVPLKEKVLWEVGKGNLYDVNITFGQDKIKSYFGLRNVRLDGYKFLINEKSVFQRLVLDQGFYPDGIYTAPSDRELELDIDRSIAMGFNGARLHQKVFEERFLYHCDKKGYIVWGEYPCWGLDYSRFDALSYMLPEWEETLDRDFNHPAIIGWCPFNETWDFEGRRQNDEVIRIIYRTTKALDNTRPCIDTSGWFHVETDIYDEHDYDQNPETFAARYEPLKTEGTYKGNFPERQKYVKGMPIFISEYGGIRWTDDKAGWGYGNAPETKEEFLSRLKGLTDALLDNPKMFAFCYTQLTDVEQEQNGLYTYDRKAKFPAEQIRPIFSRKAAIEDRE